MEYNIPLQQLPSRKSENFEWPTDASRYELMGVIGKVCRVRETVICRELLQRCIKRVV